MENNFSPLQGDILIVDDLADNLRVLSNTLSNHGYRIRAVKSGAMALVGAKAIPPDVILLDIRMPGMDGYEVCQQLKADPQLDQIPIIFLSALDETEDKAKAFKAGGADYITKPFQVEEVLARVKNQLMIQQLQKQVAAQTQQLSAIQATPANLPSAVDVDSLQDKMLSAIATILEQSDRLCQIPTLPLEQAAGLKVISQNAQNLLNLLSSLN